MLKEDVICKRCLLSELNNKEYFKSVYDYIKRIPEQIKTDETTYQNRLSLCKSCDNLINGMCKLCGCFVETRAIKAKMSCPDIKKRW